MYDYITSFGAIQEIKMSILCCFDLYLSMIGFTSETPGQMAVMYLKDLNSSVYTVIVQCFMPVFGTLSLIGILIFVRTYNYWLDFSVYIDN